MNNLTEVHVRHGGNSTVVQIANMVESSDSQIVAAVAAQMGEGVSLSGYQVDRQGETLIVRPQAVYG